MFAKKITKPVSNLIHSATRWLGVVVIALCLNSCNNLGGVNTVSTSSSKKSTGVIMGNEFNSMDELLEFNNLAGNNKVRVGLLLPLSGRSEKIGENFLNAAQMAIVSSRNSPLVLVPLDTKGTVFGAIEAVNEAVRRQVDVIVGPFSTAETKAVLKVANENNITVISLSNEQSLTKEGAFVAGFAPEQEIEKMVTYAMNQGMNNFSAILPSNQYGYAFSNILKNIVNNKDGKIVKIEFYLEKEDALRRSIQTVANSYAVADYVYAAYENPDEAVIDEETNKPKPKEFIVKEEDKIYADAIFIPEGGRRLNSIVSTLKTYNADRHNYKLLGSTYWDATFDNINKYYLQGEWFPAPDPEIFLQFEKDYYEIYGEYPVRFASITYDLVKTLNRIVQDQGRIGLTKEKLVGYSGFKGIDGSFRFRDDNTIERRFAVIEISGESRQVVDQPMTRFFD